MALSTRIREHIRHNLWGIVAVFIALGGTAAALPGKNQVDSGDIKKAQVKRGDLAPNSVDGSKVVDNSLNGADVDEASLNIPQQAIPTSLPPSGAAGGDLSGTYPDPQVQESALVPGGDLAGTLANAQVGEAGLAAAGDITGALNATAIANNSLGALEPGVANDEIVDGGVDTEDVQNNNLTNTDISDNDTLTDAEIDDVQRRIIIPASEVGSAALLGTAATPTVRTNTPVLQFAPAGIDDVDLAIQVPPDRVAGSAIQVRLLFSGTASGVTTIAWGLDCLAVTENTAADLVNAATTTVNVVSAGPGTSNTLRAATFGGVEGVCALANNDLLVLRAFRNGDDGDLDDNPNNAFLHFVEVEYTAER